VTEDGEGRSPEPETPEPEPPTTPEPPWVSPPLEPPTSLEPPTQLEPPPQPEPPARVEPSATPPPTDIPLVSTRQLLAASFDLLGRSGSDMRRASFYIGLVILGTVGPFALASWGLLVVGMEQTVNVFGEGYGSNADVWYASLIILALLGVVVASVESRTLAITVLAGRMVEDPVSTRRALARSRRVFWFAIVASFIAGIPVVFVQGIVSGLVATTPDTLEATSVITSTIVTALIGGPFAYVLAGVVLGDVDPFEALRRSFRVFRARKLAAAIIVVFETITALLVLLGLGSGLDLVLRVFEGLGLGPQAGPVGLAATTIGVVVVTFAFGTLLFTVMAITVAPQVVMFLGLTRATIGLDRVRPGGPDDPDLPRPERRRFRWLTRSMLVGFALGGVGLALTLAMVAA
jgi:hypothetical protein